MSKTTQPFTNATFHAFRPSGAWYSSERGVMDETIFHVFDDRLGSVLNLNNGKWPGFCGSGQAFMRIVIIDDGLYFGWPLMFAAGE